MASKRRHITRDPIASICAAINSTVFDLPALSQAVSQASHTSSIARPREPLGDPILRLHRAVKAFASHVKLPPIALLAAPRTHAPVVVSVQQYEVRAGIATAPVRPPPHVAKPAKAPTAVAPPPPQPVRTGPEPVPSKPETSSCGTSDPWKAFCWLPPKHLLPPVRVRKLRRALWQLAKKHSGHMRVGACIIHLSSGEQSSVDGKRRYPLASVVKTALLVEAARQLQQSQARGWGLSLRTPITITEDIKCIGAGKLQKARHGTPITLGECIELMITVSDNTASDLVLREVRLHKVRQMCRDLGLHMTDIYLSQRQAYLVALGRAPGAKGRGFLARWLGMSTGERIELAEAAERENAGVRLNAFQNMEKNSFKVQKTRSATAHQHDLDLVAAIDNHASPYDTARLLELLGQNRVRGLNGEWSEYCLAVLGRQRYGKRRFLALLPAGTPIYHKTGSISGVVNDAGIIDIGSKANRVAVAALISNVQHGREAEAEQVIARIARLAWEAYAPSHLRDAPAAFPIAA
eukprot:jgi/Chlat1/8846/Chrsp91S08184